MSLHRICLAYSGGLDTSVIIPWLKGSLEPILSGSFLVMHGI